MALRAGAFVDTLFGAMRGMAQAARIEVLSAVNAPAEKPAALYITIDQCVPILSFVADIRAAGARDCSRRSMISHFRYI